VQENEAFPGGAIFEFLGLSEIKGRFFGLIGKLLIKVGQ